MTTYNLQIQADLILNTSAARRSVDRLNRRNTGRSGVSGGGSRRSGTAATEAFSLARELRRGLGLGGLSGGAVGLLGAGGAAAGGIAGITALGVAAHRSSRLLGTSAYREFHATTVRLRYQWNLFAAQIGDIILPILSRFARTLTRIIGFLTYTRNAEGARASTFLSNLNPGFHAGGTVRRSGAYNLRQGEEVLTQNDRRNAGGGAHTGIGALEVYEGLRRAVHDGTLDLLFARPRLPNLIPQPVEVVGGVLGAGAGGDELVEVLSFSKTDFDALTDRDDRTLYLVHSGPSTQTPGTGGGTGPTTPTTPSMPTPFTLELPNPGPVDFHKGFPRIQYQYLSAVIRQTSGAIDPNRWTYSISALPAGIAFDSSRRRLRSFSTITATAGTYPVTYTAIEVSDETTPTTLTARFNIRIVAAAGEPPP